MTRNCVVPILGSSLKRGCTILYPSSRTVSYKLEIFLCGIQDACGKEGGLSFNMYHSHKALNIVLARRLEFVWASHQMVDV